LPETESQRSTIKQEQIIGADVELDLVDELLINGA